jgi:hypothetical protein
MALTVKRITLWRREVENQPGVLARTLEPLAAAGADLRLVMGYRFPEATTRAAIEVYPVTGRKATARAEQAGSTSLGSRACSSRATTAPASAPPWAARSRTPGERRLPRLAGDGASVHRRLRLRRRAARGRRDEGDQGRGRKRPRAAGAGRP